MTQEAALATILARRPDLMEAFSAVASLGLPDAWIGAGALRNAAWDALHGFVPSPPADVDVVYMDRQDSDGEGEAGIEAALGVAVPGLPWEVRNQARMHARNNDAPYLSTTAAVARWPETATAVIARLEANGQLKIIAPWGLDDLMGLVLRPAPGADRTAFARRLAAKRWTERWPRLRLEEA